MSHVSTSNSNSHNRVPMSPGTRLVRLAAISPAQITRRRFGRGFLTLKDPQEGAGVRLPAYSFFTTYPVDREKHPQIIGELYANVYGHVRAGSLPGTEVEVVDYDDVRTGPSEAPRRYIVIRQETRRSTHMSVHTTFRSYGDYLYVSVDAYLVPPLALGRLVLMALLIWIATKFGSGPFVVMKMFGLTDPLTYYWVFVLAVVAWLNRVVLRGLVAGDPLERALRRKYFKMHNWGTFNFDDVMMHLKSSSQMLIEAIQGVFERNDIPVEVLERVRDNINMSTNVTVNGGMLSVLGDVVGGAANRTRKRA